MRLADVADAAHRRACRILSIKASPPSYVAGVRDLTDVLSGMFRDDVRPIFDRARRELLDQLDENERTGKKNVRKLQAIIRRMREDLARAGSTEKIAKEMGDALVAMYRLGQADIMSPLGFGLPRFDLPDADAIGALHKSGLYWIGRHYGEALPDRDRMLGLVQEALEEGVGRVEAGRRLSALFDGVIERNDVYWRGFASTVATRSRSFGALSGMERVGATEYEYVNPLDERTSEVCRRLNGTVFRVEEAARLRDELVETADTPEKWKALSPWPKPAELDGLSPAELQARGMAWPPMHFHCRSSIDVHTFGDFPDFPHMAPEGEEDDEIDWTVALRFPDTKDTPWEEARDSYSAFGTLYEDANDNLPWPQRQAIKDYTGHEYSDMNRALRTGIESAPAALKSKIERATAGIMSSPAPENLIGWRGISSEMDGFLKAREAGTLAPGLRVVDEAFQSVSINKAVARGFAGSAGWGRSPIHLEVRIPKGTPSMWVDYWRDRAGELRDPISVNSGEQEILLRPGAVYEVIEYIPGGSLDDAGNPVDRVVVQVVG